ncbi:DMSO/selenate family reductase complex B subunit [Desulfosporosinus sp. PR]|uniref:DMSO/selenate family reductase complex B subunit n=1 Tax=Candidatus Desulfosporosinus nitrosoreducens TaxID=3401928 RepID=UPI0027EC3878|nr:DMSO/selenate family reductase complex B subunit [Desulfosporosinus sp. PR]MDQ7093644.1 DMSO/selenate family reductase complex B subunit [Desulfosporosinus sp. PR]
MTQLGFHIDMGKCIGCKTCQIACKDKNDLHIGALFRRVYDLESGKFPKPRLSHISLGCNHCAQPNCVRNCPTGAMYKRAEDGLVLHDNAKCIGCRLCVWSCPYGAPQYIEAEGKVGKCTFCDDLLAKGENPACVDACIMRAIDYGDMAELRRKYGDTPSAQGMPDPNITHPSLTITLKKK